MEVYRKSSWLLLLLGVSLLATALQGVQGEVESEGPSESECRPYIEKALKELETGEAGEILSPDPNAGDSKEDIPTVEITTDDSSHQVDIDSDNDTEGDGDDDVHDDSKEAEDSSKPESVENDTAEADISKQEEIEQKIEKVSEEKVHFLNSLVAKISSFFNAKTKQDKSQEAIKASQDKDDDNKSDDKKDDDSKESHDSKEQDAKDDSKEVGDSKEDDTPSKEDDAHSKEDDAQSKEEDKDSKEAVDSKEDDTASKEDDKDDSKEGEDQIADATEDSKEDDKDSKEDDKESVEDGKDSKEDNKDSKEDGKDSKEDDKDSKEDGEDSKEDGRDSKEDDNKESVEAAPESEEDDKTKSVEELADSGEHKEESDEQKDDDTKEESLEKAESVEQLGEAPQADEPSAETKEEASKEDDKESVEDQKDDSKEEHSKEEHSKEGDDKSAEDDKKSEEKHSKEDKDSKEDDKDSKEAADDDSKEGSDEDGEAPEEELTMDIEIPSELRPRDHVERLLKLDSESSDVEEIINKVSEVTLRELKKLYENAIKPLEVLYKYRDLSNRHFGDAEIFSKPLILFMGPWSGGKSSIINYLVNNEYNETSLRTGAEPSPAYFNILMYGEEPEILDGTELAADYTFSGLQKFGQGLEERLRGVKLPFKLLEKVNIVEIPGILEVRKQVSRVFPFNDACQWFIDRADIIFLVYDPSKLDVGPETEAILDQLKGREHQTRIILNKADQVKPEELMRVQAALIWNISPLMSSPQPPVMYTTSLWSRPYEPWAPVRLLQAQERAFLRDLRGAIDKRIENKIASARRFAVRVRNHAKMVDCYLTTYYNHKSVFGNRKQVADEIIEHPQDYHIYEGLSTLTNISRYDLPDPDVYKDFFKLNPLYEFQQLSATCTYFRGCPINRLDIAIAYDLPELVGTHKKLVESALAGSNPSTNSPPAS